jgi:segregation and condensation protein B
MSLKSKLESLLLISQKPLTNKELAEFLKVNWGEVEAALLELTKEYQEQKRGWQIIKNNGKYQLVTAPENGKLIKDFLHDETSGELTQPSLEALTVIAYRGPITKFELDRIRGVNCSLIIRNLLIRGLIEENFDKFKNETYYTVSLDFIRFLGISQIEDLPDYSKLHVDQTLQEFLDEAAKNQI